MDESFKYQEGIWNPCSPEPIFQILNFENVYHTNYIRMCKTNSRSVIYWELASHIELEKYLQFEIRVKDYRPGHNWSNKNEYDWVDYK